MSQHQHKQQTEVETLTKALSAPFELTEVKFKPAVVSGNRAMALAYVDARVIQDRLDDVLGVAGWQDDYECREDGSVVCRLRLRLGGAWVTKMDVGSPSEQPDEHDRLKAAFSDALKRAAVKFGIGRYLYRLPAQWLDYDAKKRQFLTQPTLPAFARPAREKPKLAATEAPKSKTRPKPAATGDEFVRRLEEYDAKLASQKVCGKGDLVRHITQAGIQAGYDADLSKWDAAAIAFAHEQTRQFEGQVRQRGAA